MAVDFVANQCLRIERGEVATVGDGDRQLNKEERSVIKWGRVCRRGCAHPEKILRVLHLEMVHSGAFFVLISKSFM